MARIPAKCCWCGSRFVKVGSFYWCRTEKCRELQAAYSVVARKDTDGDPDNRQYIFLNVPLPKQVEFEMCGARNLLGGGGAGSCKSHEARWSLYRRAIRIPYYEALLLRETWNELESHQLRLMEQDADVFNTHGIPCTFAKTARTLTFHDTKAVIEGGHMETEEDVKKYLGRERDDIAVDEGVNFKPNGLKQLSTRARSVKEAVLRAGGARFRVYTNPGGPSAAMLRELFIDKDPNWEDYSEEFKEAYDPENWHYIPGSVEDNPYLPPSYQDDLAVLQPWRFKQLRYNDWDIVAGTFFTEFLKSYHVKDLGDPGENVEWFRSLDWGYTKPGCMLWWAMMPDGVCYIRYELKFSHMLIETFAEEVFEIDKMLGVRPHQNLRYTVADPALRGVNVNKTENGIITGETMDQTFAAEGIPLVMGKNQRVQGWQRTHQLLGSRGDIEMADENGVFVSKDLGPHVYIHPDCKYLIRAFSGAVSKKSDPEDIDYDDDHPLDSFRYGAMSRPQPTRRQKVFPANSFMAHRKKLIAFRKRQQARSA